MLVTTFWNADDLRGDRTSEEYASLTLLKSNHMGFGGLFNGFCALSCNIGMYHLVSNVNTGNNS